MNQEIRLEKVHINNLFHRFTYDIDLRNGQDVSILIAPNGCGKTTIFNLIYFIFTPSLSGYKTAVSIPFESLDCFLSNGNCVTLKKVKPTPRKKKKDNSHKQSIVVIHEDEEDTYTNTISVDHDLILSVINSPSSTSPLSLNLSESTEQITSILKESPFVDDIDLFSIDVATEEDIAIFPSPIRTILKKLIDFTNSVHDFLHTYNCDLDVSFIKADRLHKPAIAKMSRYIGYAHEINKQPNPLENIQKKTQKLIKEISDEYSNRQSEAKDKLPKLYLENQDVMEFNIFEKRWITYINDLNKYAEIGLISKPQPMFDKVELANAYRKRKEFLTVYLKAFEQTLEPLEREYTKLKLFKDILDQRNRITHKSIRYGSEGIIISVDGEPLPLECLSSGEKNDLIMFYNLIFESTDYSLVLIDEPEISLHIEWQEAYLDSLVNICKMNHLQAIVATHSPNIVNGHLELYAKRGLTNDRH